MEKNKTANRQLAIPMPTLSASGAVRPGGSLVMVFLQYLLFTAGRRQNTPILTGEAGVGKTARGRERSARGRHRGVPRKLPR
jgi:hypothetical protein